MHPATEAQLRRALHQTATYGAGELLRGWDDVGTRLEQISVLGLVMALAHVTPQQSQHALPSGIALWHWAPHAELVHLPLALFIWKHPQVVTLAHGAEFMAGDDLADALEAEVSPTTHGQVGGTLDRTETYRAREVLGDAIDVDPLVVKVLVFACRHITFCFCQMDLQPTYDYHGDAGISD